MVILLSEFVFVDPSTKVLFNSFGLLLVSGIVIGLMFIPKVLIVLKGEENALKELYVIVIDEPQTELESAIMNNGLENDYTADLKGYSRLIIDGIDPSVKVDTVADFKDGTLNGMKSRQLNMTGITNGVNIYWKFAFLEGKNNYYQIMVWTLADNKKKFDDDMQDIINSFKETDRSAKQ